MLKVCLDDREILHLLLRAAEDQGRAEAPEDVIAEERRRGARNRNGHIFLPNEARIRGGTRLFPQLDPEETETPFGSD